MVANWEPWVWFWFCRKNDIDDRVARAMGKNNDLYVPIAAEHIIQAELSSYNNTLIGADIFSGTIDPYM